MWLMRVVFPEKPVEVKPTREMAALVLGGVSTGVEPVNKLARDRASKIETNEDIALQKEREAKREAEEKEKAKQKEKEPAKTTPFELIAMGRGDKPYYLQVLLNTLGGSVQRVILTEFPEAGREGLMVKRADGSPAPEPIIPGSKLQRKPTMREQEGHYYEDLQPGVIKDFDPMDWVLFHPPSYLMFHYEKANDERPEYELGGKIWNFLKDESELDPDADSQKVVFETKLETENHQLRIRKTYSLKRKDYHLGMKIELFPLEPGKKHEPLRYQLTGANNMPIEGEWYTSTFRQAIIGFEDKKGNSSRVVTDGQEVGFMDGSDRIRRDEKRMIRFASVNVQYFASVLAVDNEQVEGQKQDFVEFVRATPMGERHKDKPNLDDLTVRAITEPLDADKNITHQYLLYQGPLKVRLLAQLPGDKAVNDDLVDRYLNKLHLRVLTDAPMDNAIGRFANSIYWSDLVIAFTNLIHSLLYLLYQIIPVRGLCIICITLIVRGLLFPISRRQNYNMAVNQAKMAKLAPETKKLTEQYGKDPLRLHQEKMKLMREHGISPFAALGGCFLFLLQWPVMMGLYYALGESIFFRLDSFLWMPNLAAPDMLIYWGEAIPFISSPTDMGSTFYLGPYLNILPIATVILMLIQQSKMMPPTDDPQMQAQQKMMKFMMIFMAFIFFKMAAGMCIYFLASTLWALAEKKIIGKVDLEKIAEAQRRKQEELASLPPRPLGYFGRMKQRWRQKWQEILEEAKKQNEHKREPRPPQNPAPTSTSTPDADGKRGKKKKKKK
jgi:YidC/Oxa1 family membrane protein insertase